MNYSVQHQAVPTASARLQPCAQVTASARAAICRDWLTLQHKNGSVDFTLFSHRGWAEGMVPAPLQPGLEKGTTQRTQRIRLRESSTAASKVALPATRPADNQRDAAFNRTRSDPASLEENTHLTPALKSPSVTSSGQGLQQGGEVVAAHPCSSSTRYFQWEHRAKRCAQPRPADGTNSQHHAAALTCVRLTSCRLLSQDTSPHRTHLRHRWHSGLWTGKKTP